MIMAGRGFGKTRAGAEWVRQIAQADPTARIALAATLLAEGRAVMVEGESGLLAVSPPDRSSQFAVRTVAAPRPLRQRGAGAIALGRRAGKPARPAAQPRLVRRPQKQLFVNQSLAILNVGPADRDSDPGRAAHRAEEVEYNLVA